MVLEMALRDFAPVPPVGLRWDQPLWRRDAQLDVTKLKLAPGRGDEHPTTILLAKLKDGMSNKDWQTASGWSEGTYRRKRDELLRNGSVLLEMGLYRRA